MGGKKAELREAMGNAFILQYYLCSTGGLMIGPFPRVGVEQFMVGVTTTEVSWEELKGQKLKSQHHVKHWQP